MFKFEFNNIINRGIIFLEAKDLSILFLLTENLLATIRNKTSLKLDSIVDRADEASLGE